MHGTVCLPFAYLIAAMLPVDSLVGEMKRERAIFAGGCFWCMEAAFEHVEGVLLVRSGYTGGASTDPTYETYADGGHVEAVEVVYDPSKVSYEKLLSVFWRQIDPTDPNGQFADRGRQYSAAVFYISEEQRRLAENSKKDLEASGRFDKPIVTPILPAGPFYLAEAYHQDFYKKHPSRYRFYRSRSGRDAFLNKTWKEERVDKDRLKKDLPPRNTT